MWPLCRNVTRPWRLMALLGLVSWGGAQSSEVPSEGDSQQAQLMKGAYLEPPFVCDALSDPQLYQDGAMSGMRQLVSGKPYWFFRTDVDLQEDFPVSAMARGELGELVEQGAAYRMAVIVPNRAVRVGDGGIVEQLHTGRARVIDQRVRKRTHIRSFHGC